MSKFIKNFLILNLFIMLIFSLTACDYGYNLYNQYTYKDKKIIMIELINYDNPTAIENPKEKYSLDLTKLELLETLDVDKIDSFLIELSEIGGLTDKHKNLLNSPNGIGIKLNYQDNFFRLILVTLVEDRDCIFLGHYDADANAEGYFGISWQEMIDDFKALVNEYFVTQI